MIGITIKCDRCGAIISKDSVNVITAHTLAPGATHSCVICDSCFNELMDKIRYTINKIIKEEIPEITDFPDKVPNLKLLRRYDSIDPYDLINHYSEDDEDY